MVDSAVAVADGREAGGVPGGGSSLARPPAPPPPSEPSCGGESAKMSAAATATAGGASSVIVCYAPTMISTNGLWQGDNPLNYSLPLFILQVILVVVVTRVLAVVLKPFRQPRFVAEVIGGVLLGPSVLGKVPNYMAVVFPPRSVAVVETLANLGLVYFIFLVGLEMDLGIIKRAGRRPWAVAFGSSMLPYATAVLAFLPFWRTFSDPGAFILFVGASLSATAFSVLTRILADLKLLGSDIGRTVISASFLSNAFSWLLLTLSIAAAGNRGSVLEPLGVIFSGTTFIFVIYLVAKPAVTWILRRTPEGEAVDDSYICIVMTAVMACGLAADALGIHAIIGSFCLGLMIPNGPVGSALVEKLEDFVTGFMLPLFFAINGLRVDTTSITDPQAAWPIVFTLLLGAAAKVGSVLLVSMFYGTPTREGLSMGILMNTKGLTEVIILHIALEKKVLDQQSFSVMVLTSVAVTAVVTPLVTAVYKPARHFVSYKRRTVQRSKPDSELRMVTCVHTTRNVPAIISLLELSNPTKRSPIFVYALQLVELTGRESAMLIVHEARHRHGGERGTNLNRMQAQSEQIINAFEGYEQHAGGVSVQPLTAVSAYSSMHEDICNVAEDKRVALVVLPFHKQQTVDGGMEVINPGIRTVNQSVLANAPCSVGILVDRGFGGTATRGAAAGQSVSHQVALLFFGGPDDREALAYAWRMAERPGISLTVLRFILGGEAVAAVNTMPRQQTPVEVTKHARVLNLAPTEQERELQLDDDYIKDFRMKNASDESVVYTERVVNNGEETVAAIRSMEGIYDLFIVGRGEGMSSPLTAGLTDWSECPELGVIGDLMASTDFGATVSVLVVQQYKGGFHGGEGPGTPDSPAAQQAQYLFGRGNRRGTSWGMP